MEAEFIVENVNFLLIKKTCMSTQNAHRQMHTRMHARTNTNDTDLVKNSCDTVY